MWGVTLLNNFISEGNYIFFRQPFKKLKLTQAKNLIQLIEMEAGKLIHVKHSIHYFPDRPRLNWIDISLEGI